MSGPEIDSFSRCAPRINIKSKHIFSSCIDYVSVIIFIKLKLKLDYQVSSCSIAVKQYVQILSLIMVSVCVCMGHCRSYMC